MITIFAGIAESLIVDEILEGVPARSITCEAVEDTIRIDAGYFERDLADALTDHNIDFTID